MEEEDFLEKVKICKEQWEIKQKELEEEEEQKM